MATIRVAIFALIFQIVVKTEGMGPYPLSIKPVLVSQQPEAFIVTSNVDFDSEHYLHPLDFRVPLGQIIYQEFDDESTSYDDEDYYDEDCDDGDDDETSIINSPHSFYPLPYLATLEQKPQWLEVVEALPVPPPHLLSIMWTDTTPEKLSQAVVDCLKNENIKDKNKLADALKQLSILLKEKLAESRTLSDDELNKNTDKITNIKTTQTPILHSLKGDEENDIFINIARNGEDTSMTKTELPVLEYTTNPRVKDKIMSRDNMEPIHDSLKIKDTPLVQSSHRVLDTSTAASEQKSKIKKTVNRRRRKKMKGVKRLNGLSKPVSTSPTPVSQSTTTYPLQGQTHENRINNEDIEFTEPVYSRFSYQRRSSKNKISKFHMLSVKNPGTSKSQPLMQDIESN
ncbi:unnamed protein product [Leptosia nina]|uniref:Uncharacterized protein n=1 Tax=Leptosia nina TaxID=320188 RepID=A0AAV1JU87_9NEOP